jgi:hypothetical protein
MRFDDIGSVYKSNLQIASTIIEQGEDEKD